MIFYPYISIIFDIFLYNFTEEFVPLYIFQHYYVCDTIVFFETLIFFTINYSEKFSMQLDIILKLM